MQPAALVFWISLMTFGSDPDTAPPWVPEHALLRLGSPQFLPATDSIHRIEYSFDGKYVATAGFAELGSNHPGVQIWERSTGRDVTPARLKGAEISGISWGPGARFVTSNGSDSQVLGLNLWRVGDDAPQFLGHGHETFSTVAWSPKGNRLAARSKADRVYVFDLDGNELQRLPFARKVIPTARTLDFTPDGRQLAVASEQGVRIYDVDQGNLIRELEITAEQINVVRVLPGGMSVAVGTDKTLQIIPIDGADQAISTYGDKGAIDCAFSRDGKWVLTTDFGSRCMAWDRRTGKGIQLLKTWGAGIAVSPEDSEVAVPSRRLSFLKLGTWQSLSAGDEHRLRLSRGCLANGRLWTGEYGPEIREWNLETGQPSRKWKRQAGTSVALVEIDDHHLAVAGGIARIEIYDSRTGDVTATLAGHLPITGALAISKRQNRLISAGFDGDVRCWDLGSKKMVYEIHLGQQSVDVSSLATLPDKNLFAFGNANLGVVSVHRITDGSLVWKSSTGESQTVQSLFMPVAFTADSRHLWSLFWKQTSDDLPQVWSIVQRDVDSGKEIARMDHGSSVIPVLAVSPDGSLLVIGVWGWEKDAEIQIWSLKTHQRVALLSGHLDRVSGLHFTPDGKKLISLSHDSTAIVWDVAAAVQKGAR